jgi:cell division protein FtsI/penicillin-binding protein 2
MPATAHGPPVRCSPPIKPPFLARRHAPRGNRGNGAQRSGGIHRQFAGKTGTAQLGEGMPHSWFTGFAPYDGDPSRRLAFAVLVEHGGYGARVAAPIAREVMETARKLGLIE